MSYTDEGGWTWSQRLDGSWDWGNGYVLATVWRTRLLLGARHQWQWYVHNPTDEDAEPIGGLDASVAAAKAAAENAARRLGYTEACARLERDEAIRERDEARAALSGWRDRVQALAAIMAVQDRTGPTLGISWLIVGGESGPGARPMNLAWARSIVQQCEASATACFVKQLGAKPFAKCDDCTCNGGEVRYSRGHNGCDSALSLTSRKGADMEEWPPDLRVRQMPEARTWR